MFMLLSLNFIMTQLHCVFTVLMHFPTLIVERLFPLTHGTHICGSASYTERHILNVINN